MKTVLLLTVMFIAGTALAHPPAVSQAVAKRIVVGMIVANPVVLGQHIGRQPIAVISLLKSMEVADIPTPVANAFARNILRQLEPTWWEARFQAGVRGEPSGPGGPPRKKQVSPYEPLPHEDEYHQRRIIEERTPPGYCKKGSKKGKSKRLKNPKRIG